ncbi:putative disease resistance protein [Nymphaea thermarum]|nr:putative disease resistance protein [Nymphaea thermarum]
MDGECDVPVLAPFGVPLSHSSWTARASFLVHANRYRNAIFPELEDLEIHYATNLVHLPPAVCEMRKLQKLNITKCPDLKSLPEGLNQLTNLKYLNIYACSSLEGLPDSICELKNLRVLDMCDCSMVERFPKDLGSLSCLARIDMRHCSRIDELPPSVRQMRALELVFCDEEIKHRWDQVKHRSALSNLKIDVAVEKTDLNFLL